MSKLIDKLSKQRQSEPQQMGFMLRKAEVEKPKMLLLAELSADNLGKWGEALKAADGLIVDVNKPEDLTSAEKASQGDNLRAALWDFAGNLAVGAVPKTVMGFGVIFPYPWVAYQGWVGGIVSVRGDHTSRLNDPRSATYYLLTLLLQVIQHRDAGFEEVVISHYCVQLC